MDGIGGWMMMMSSLPLFIPFNPNPTLPSVNGKDFKGLAERGDFDVDRIKTFGKDLPPFLTLPPLSINSGLKQTSILGTFKPWALRTPWEIFHRDLGILFVLQSLASSSHLNPYGNQVKCGRSCGIIGVPLRNPWQQHLELALLCTFLPEKDLNLPI